MSESPVVTTQAFKDRRAGLIVFGVLEILIGCFCALMIPLMFWGQAMQTKMTGTPPNHAMMVPGAVFYAIIAVAFVWLGVGSILCRRWARALMLILSWSWLLVGVVAVGFNAFLMPRVMETMPAQMRTAALIGAMIVLGVMFIIIPGAIMLFYRGRNVKATCEARDPVRRWTDACPLPVLAASLCLGIGALSMLSIPLGYKSVMPFCGVLISGLPATVILVVWAILWSWLAWALYRLNPMAWWITVVAFVLLGVSNAITFMRVDLMEMYRQMGYPEQQIAQMQKFSVISGKNVAAWTAFCVVPCAGYLLWIKKFFRRSV